MGRVASSRGVVTSHHPAQGRAAREPSGPAALGWLSRVRGASSSGTNAAGTREPRFGGRHRTFRSRVRSLEGGAPFWASQRGTRHPDIDSRPLGAVFVRIWGESCTDRSSSRGPLVARPAALSPPRCATNSRARGPRAVLADPNALLGWPKVAEAARLPGRGLGPYPTNLRVRNYVHLARPLPARRASPARRRRAR